MKLKPNIIDVISIKRLTKAFKTSTKDRYKYKISAMKFVRNFGFNIFFLKELINLYLFINKGYSIFTIQDRKKREVHAPCYRDKLIQHSINNAIKPMLENSCILDSYACITGRGPQKAIMALRSYQYNAFKEYKYPKLVKIDISKFFYTINRDKIFTLLCRRIECEDFRILLAEKLKFTYSPKGLPLGNLTSQQFANMLLNEFDHYIKDDLKIKYYVRYADDIFIIVNGKDNARKVLKNCIKWLDYNLDLKCNPNKCFHEPATTIVALGYKIFYNNKYNNNIVYLLSRNKNTLYKTLQLEYVKDKSIRSIMLLSDKSNSKRSIYRKATVEDIVLRLNSWKGHAKLANLEKYIERTLERSKRKDIVYENGKFKVKEGYEEYKI